VVIGVAGDEGANTPRKTFDLFKIWAKCQENRALNFDIFQQY